MFQGGWAEAGISFGSRSPSANECEWDEERGKDADLVAVCKYVFIIKAGSSEITQARKTGAQGHLTPTVLLIPPLSRKAIKSDLRIDHQTFLRPIHLIPTSDFPQGP